MSLQMTIEPYTKSLERDVYSSISDLCKLFVYIPIIPYINFNWTKQTTESRTKLKYYSS